MTAVIDWPKAVVLSTAEFDVARDLLDLGPNPAVLELLSPGVTDVERARVVRDAMASLASRGLFDGARFPPGLVEDLRTVIAPEMQRDLLTAPPYRLHALVGTRRGTAVLAARIDDEVALVRVAAGSASAALVELLGPVAPGAGPAVRVPARVLTDAVDACGGDRGRLTTELLRRGTSGAETALLDRMGDVEGMAQLGAGRGGPDACRAPGVLLVHATAHGCYYQRRPVPERIGGPLPDDAVVHAGPAAADRLAEELDRLADAARDPRLPAGARR